MENNTLQTEQYKSKFGAIMSFVGMAVGLGNIWRFPYMVGEYGGGAFVAAYLICIFLIVMPMAILECALGRNVGKGMIEVYEACIKNKAVSKVIGSLCGLVYTAQNFFFIPTVAMIVYFLYVCATGMWNDMPATEIYDACYDNNIVMVLLVVALTALIVYTVFRGVQGGIEKISTYLVPLMFVFFIFVAIYAAFTIDGIGAGYDWFLRPDFSRMASIDLWVAALGQALFSIGVGPGAIIIYGTHIGADKEVTLSMMNVCFLDTAAATLAGMAIIPSCIAMGLNPESGSKLIFVVLPELLSRIPMGNLIGIVLFLAMFFAAITSAIANLEIGVVTYYFGFKISREKMTIITGVIMLIGALIAVFSQGWYAFWDMAIGTYGYIIGAGIGAIAYGYCYGVEKLRTESINPTSPFKLGKWYTRWVTIIAIPFMVFIMFNSLFPVL